MGMKDNIVYLFDVLNFELMWYDVMFLFYVEVDEIYNFVCLVLFVYYQCDLVQMMKISVYGVINLFGFVKCVKVCILQVLMSEVYGDLDVYLQDEYYCGCVNLIGICVCYDEGKCCVEMLFFDYYCQYGVDVWIVWIFNMYGLCMYLVDGCVVLNFVMQVFVEQLLIVYGDGKQMCLFCYVDDMVDVLIWLMDELGDVSELVNFGSDVEIVMIDVVWEVVWIVGVIVLIEFWLLLFDDLCQWWLNFVVVQKWFGWCVMMMFVNGFVYIVCYFIQCQVMYYMFGDFVCSM